MFAPSSASGAAEGSSEPSLFRVMDVKGTESQQTEVKDAQEAMESAARRRLAKANMANQNAAERLHKTDPRRANLYDEKDAATFDDDLENMIDVAEMGETARNFSKGSRFGASKGGKADEYNDILDGERIEPLNMKEELRKGEVGLYGEMKSKKKRKDGEDDPSELAMPESGPNGSKKRSAKAERLKKRRKIATSDDEDSDSSSEDDEDEEEEVDPWLASVSKDESMYASKKRKSESKENTPTPNYLIDAATAMKELQEMLKEGPAGENVLKLIKRITPSSNKRSKMNEKDVPHTNTEDARSQDDIEERKAKFEKCVSIADFLMDGGYTTVYEATFEDLAHRLNPKKGKRAQDADEETQTEEEIEQGREGAFWQYKWSLEAEEIFGPFDTDSMKGWAPSFAQFPAMVVRGVASPSKTSKLGPNDLWMPFEALLWS